MFRTNSILNLPKRNTKEQILEWFIFDDAQRCVNIEYLGVSTTFILLLLNNTRHTYILEVILISNIVSKLHILISHSA
jgi:hypothetical protein